MFPNPNDAILRYIPNITPEELTVIRNRTSDFSESEITQFCAMYASRRVDPKTLMLTCLLGFVGVAGVHRFLVGHIGMGILYFLTAGLCFVGTVVDLINIKSLAIQHNSRKIAEVLLMLRPHIIL